MRISPDEYHDRFEALHASIRRAGLDLFIVTSFDSIYYLTGTGFEPLERPFFLLVSPGQPSRLLVPKLDHEHMKKAHAIAEENIHTYRDYPAPDEVGEIGFSIKSAAPTRSESSRFSARRPLAGFAPASNRPRFGETLRHCSPAIGRCEQTLYPKHRAARCCPSLAITTLVVNGSHAPTSRISTTG